LFLISSMPGHVLETLILSWPSAHGRRFRAHQESDESEVSALSPAQAERKRRSLTVGRCKARRGSPPRRGPDRRGGGGSSCRIDRSPPPPPPPPPGGRDEPGSRPARPTAGLRRGPAVRRCPAHRRRRRHPRPRKSRRVAPDRGGGRCFRGLPHRRDSRSLLVEGAARLDGQRVPPSH